MTLYDGFGLVGVLIILAAYMALQSEKLSIKDWRYSGANAAGAGLILVSLCFSFNLASFIIEIVWLIISLWGVWRALSRKNKTG